MAHGIFYRSDTRWPDNYDKLFETGFAKRNAEYAEPKLRQVNGGGVDVEPGSAVCITRDIFAAPVFPIAKLWAEPWIYLFDLDLSKVFNTQSHQYQEAVNMGGEDGFWPMFGQERAVNEVLPQEIIGAIQVKRKFHGPTWETGGIFTPLQCRANPLYKRNQVNTKRMHEAFKSLNGKQLSMPTISSGYIKVEKPAGAPPVPPPKTLKFPNANDARPPVPPKLPKVPKIASANAPPPPVPPKKLKVSST